MESVSEALAGLTVGSATDPLGAATDPLVDVPESEVSKFLGLRTASIARRVSRSWRKVLRDALTRRGDTDKLDAISCTEVVAFGVGDAPHSAPAALLESMLDRDIPWYPELLVVQCNVPTWCPDEYREDIVSAWISTHATAAGLLRGLLDSASALLLCRKEAFTFISPVAHDLRVH
mmetsp:Transcript_4865/g.14740  ORF Transcript_4865/g.14740 Transcript_4865/m.14740 type:complete len:176 (+) Transcript_4865:173-700(+)